MTAKNLTNSLTHDLRSLAWLNTSVITLALSAFILFSFKDARLTGLVITLGILVGIANHLFILRYYRKRTEDKLTNTFEQLHNEMNFDDLTRVYTRKAGSIRFREEIERARRSKEKLSVAIIDADDFKSINDTYGHLSGDEVLRTIATTIKSKLRTNDILYRYGGEEFVIIMPNTNEADSSVPLERLREQLCAKTISFGGFDIRTSVSIGVSEVYDHMEDESQLIGRADIALYEAKNTGKNRIVYHTDLAGFPTAMAMGH